MTILAADWEAPPGVRAFTTVRTGGNSSGAYTSLNLGGHVGDDPGCVARNRELVRESQAWKHDPLWLDQVHGITVVRAEDCRPSEIPRADGAVTSQRGRPLAVLTADCLPVVACDADATVIGAFHAGWKGLLAGVVEAGVAALDRPAGSVHVWLGPAIGPKSYQVGSLVRDAYLAANPEHEAEFAADTDGHWKFDLAGAAVRRLSALGMASVTRSRWDTFRDADLFFSHRRQAPCGRMATFIVLESRSEP